MNKLLVNCGPGGDTVSSGCRKIIEVLKTPDLDQEDIMDIIYVLEQIVKRRR